MPNLWSINENGHSYDLCLDGNFNWVWRIDDNKIIMRYNEEKRCWMGVANGKIIKIVWPTFRDIIQDYLKQANEI